MSARRSQYEPVVISSQSTVQYPELLYRNGSSSSSPQKCTSAAAGKTNKRSVKEHSNILYSILSCQIDLQSPPVPTTSKYCKKDEVVDMEVGVSEYGGQGSPIDPQMLSLDSGNSRHRESVFPLSSKQRLLVRPEEIENTVKWRKNKDMSRTPSRDSFLNVNGHSAVSSDESLPGGNSNDAFGWWTNSERNAEELVEQARNKMTRLSTDGIICNSISDGTICSSKSESSILCPVEAPVTNSLESLSNPGTPRSSICDEMNHRKYSMGSRYAQNMQGSTACPVDLSCKRKRVESCSSVQTIRRPPANIIGDDFNLALGGAVDHSLLRAKLRGRSSTFSTAPLSTTTAKKNVNVTDVSLLEAALRGRSSTFSIGMHPSSSNFNSFIHRNGSSKDCFTPQQLWLASRQYVTLAKRNLNPVKARVLERLTAMTTFALDLPEFCVLPFADQRSLLIGAMHRLLLLFMAETNLEFAVTTIQKDDNLVMDEANVSETSATEKMRRRNEVPTMQFVESVQNFIGKCQAINIRPSEYFFMRWIILFHPSECCSTLYLIKSCYIFSF